MRDQESLNRAAAEVESAQARVAGFRDSTADGPAHDRLTQAAYTLRQIATLLRVPL